MIDKRELKQIKDDLKTLGFKEKKFYLGGKGYYYDTKQEFSLYIRFYPDNRYCAAQLVIDTHSHISMYFDYDKEMPLFINFEPDNLKSLVPVAKKAIKIVEDLNKKLKQIDSNVEKFQNLV